MEEIFDNWESPVSLPDAETELKKMRRKLRQRNRKLVIISLVLTLALLFGTVTWAVPALEGLYWDPETKTYCTHATDLGLTLYAYGNIFNNSHTVLDVTAAKTGFATYALSLDAVSYANSERVFGTGTLDKGQLTIQEGFWDDRSQSDIGNIFPDTQEHHMELLSQLPDYIQVGCYVTFREDITMEEALALEEQLIQDVFDTYHYTRVHWYAIRHREDAYYHSCGLTNDGVSGRFDGINNHYPYFSGIYQGEDGRALSGLREDIAQRKEDRFKSLLCYLRDQQEKGEGISVPNEPNFYNDALAYIEENGVKIYGLYITASASRLLEINEMDNVQYLMPVDAWIHI